jgi:hypothetical protein
MPGRGAAWCRVIVTRLSSVFDSLSLGESTTLVYERAFTISPTDLLLRELLDQRTTAATTPGPSNKGNPSPSSKMDPPPLLAKRTLLPFNVPGLGLALRGCAICAPTLPVPAPMLMVLMSLLPLLLLSRNGSSPIGIRKIDGSGAPRIFY